MFVSVAFVFMTAAAAPAAAAPVPVSAPAVKEKKICRVDDAVTGSITPKRTCKTKAEWDAMTGRSSAAEKTSGQQAMPSAKGASND
jgi:hypothetical protein